MILRILQPCCTWHGSVLIPFEGQPKVKADHTVQTAGLNCMQGYPSGLPSPRICSNSYISWSYASPGSNLLVSSAECHVWTACPTCAVTAAAHAEVVHDRTRRAESGEDLAAECTPWRMYWVMVVELAKTCFVCIWASAAKDLQCFLKIEARSDDGCLLSQLL